MDSDKEMRILITNNTLGSMPGGSEWHAHELAVAIKKSGHDVKAYSETHGWFAKSLSEKGITCYKTPPDGDYDLIIASHTSTINRIDRSRVRGKMIQICHGIYPSLEQPSSKVDEHVSISEEVQSHLKSRGLDSSVIYNGIDHERYVDKKGGDGVISLCQGELANEMIEAACSILGCKLKIMNKHRDYVYNLEEVIPDFHTVISLGRGAYEAMACNKNLIVADSRGYVDGGKFIYSDGFVTLDNVSDIMLNNCSGRRNKIKLDLTGITKMIERSLVSDNQDLRSFSKENLNISKQADKYLSMA